MKIKLSLVLVVATAVFGGIFVLIRALPGMLQSQNVRVQIQMAKADSICDNVGAMEKSKIDRTEIERAQNAYQKVLLIDPNNQQAMARLVFLACLEDDVAQENIYIDKIKSLPQHDGPLREAKTYIDLYGAGNRK